MQKIVISAPKKYTAVIGTHILKNMGNYLLDCCTGPRLVIITDSDVAKIYLNELVSDLEQLGFQILIHVFPSGESSKSLETSSEIISFLSVNSVSRFDMIVALGGGVVSDIVGFCSAIYAGGIDYIIIPTTLLSMVDSSVGGSTALNTKCYKNQIITTHFPKGVYCDISTLASLSKTILRDGIPEIVKLGIIADSSLLESVEHIVSDEDIINIVSRCINIKNMLYATHSDDIEFLSFGHTMAYAIEAYSNYSVTHGQAVSIGMSMIAKASERLGLTEKGTYNHIYNVLTHFNLKTTYDIPLDSLTKLLKYDIKKQGDSINVVLLSSIEKPFVHKVKLSRLSEFFCALY